jgi:hypothetical protein
MISNLPRICSLFVENGSIFTRIRLLLLSTIVWTLMEPLVGYCILAPNLIDYHTNRFL